MTDYDKSTGSTGTMRIRDTGTNVEFWINAGNSSTYNSRMPWAYVVNGVSSSWKYYDYQAGSGWERVGVWDVNYTQTVTFKLGDTGTSGLGGPTTFSHSISRASIPSPPTNLSVTQVTYNSAYVTFSDGASNGSAIDQRLIGIGTTSGLAIRTVSSDKSTLVTGLAPGTQYWFWARTHNSVGWSYWSPSKSVTTLSIAHINVAGVWKTAIPYVRVNGVWKQAVPWVRSAGVWKEAK